MLTEGAGKPEGRGNGAITEKQKRREANKLPTQLKQLWENRSESCSCWLAVARCCLPRDSLLLGLISETLCSQTRGVKVVRGYILAGCWMKQLALIIPLGQEESTDKSRFSSFIFNSVHLEEFLISLLGLHWRVLKNMLWLNFGCPMENYFQYQLRDMSGEQWSWGADSFQQTLLLQHYSIKHFK